MDISVTKGSFVSVSERRELRNSGLHANLVGGAGFTSVLLWNAAAFSNGNYMTGTGITNALPLASTFVVTQAVATGTAVQIIRRGKYELMLIARVPAAGGAAFGISYQAPAASLVFAVTPDMAAASTLGFVIASGLVTVPAATATSVPLTKSISVSDTDTGAAEVAGGGAGSFVRFHGTDGAAGTLADADVDQAATSYAITYVGDHMGC
jgi:hypothetical protein